VLHASVERNERQDFRKTAAVFILVALYLIAYFVSANWFPRVWMDEPWYTQNAWTYIQQGTFGNPMFSGLYGLEKSNVVYGRIYLLAAAASFSLFGLGYRQARLPSLLWGVLALIVFYMLIRDLINERIALLSTLALASSVPFLLASHDARPEMMLAFFIILAFYLLLRADRDNDDWLFFLSGLIAALSADIHMNGFVVPPALLGVLIWRRGARSIFSKQTAYMLIGVALGVAWWLMLHVMPDGKLFVEQWNHLWKSRLPAQDLITRPWLPFISEAKRYVQYAGANKAMLGTSILFVLAVFNLIRRRLNRGEATLLTFLGFMFVLMALFISNKTPSYTILVSPFVLALIVSSAIDGWKSDALRRAGRTCVILFVLVSFIAAGYYVMRFYGSDYDGFIRKLRRHIPAQAKVQGQPTYWFGFADHEYWADHYFGWGGFRYPEKVRALGIQYIIADEFMREVMVDEGKFDGNVLEEFFRNKCELVAVIRDPYYGKGYGRKPFNETFIYRVKY